MQSSEEIEIVEQKEKEPKMIAAGEHTLIITDEEREPATITFTEADFKEMLKDQPDYILDSVVGDLNVDVVPELIKKYTLYLGGFNIDSRDSSSDTANLNRMIFELSLASKNDVLEIYIASNGGYMDEGIKFIQTIQKTFKYENITTILNPHGYSMGSHLFVIGHKRIVGTDSAIMLHDYATGTSGKGNNIKDYIEHAELRMNRISKRHYVDTGYITEAEFESFKNGKDLWFETEEIIKRGIATHVQTNDGNIIPCK